MADKIKYGIKNVHYAVATIASNGSATYGTVKPLAGAVSISLDAQGDSTPFYADNIVYYTSIANNGYEGDLELARVPDDFLKDVLGYAADANGVLYEDANAPVVHFALTFQFEGDTSARRHLLYNCTAKRPQIAGSTKAEAIEPETETITVTATTIYNEAYSKDVVKASCDTTQATQYNSWNSTIYQVATA